MLTLLIQNVSLRVELTPRVRMRIEEKSSLFKMLTLNINSMWVRLRSRVVVRLWVRVGRKYWQNKMEN